MKKFFYLASVLFLIILSGCDNEEINPKKPEEEFEWYQKIKVNEDSRLLELLGSINSEVSYSGAKQMNTDFGNIDLSEATKVIDTARNTTRYALSLKETSNLIFFENLIIKDSQEGVSAYILQYEPQVAWALANLKDLNLSDYTGIIRQLDLQRNVLAETYLLKGQNNYETAPNGRVNSCHECSWQVEEVHTTGNDALYIDCGEGGEYTTFLRQACDGNGSGSTGGDGGTGSTGGSGDTGSTGGDGGTGTTGGDGDTGSTDGSGYPYGGGSLSGGDSSHDSTEFPEDGEVIPLIRPVIIDPEFALQYELMADPYKLIDNIPCEELEKWQEVSSFTPPQSVVDKMTNLADKYGGFDIQTLSNAKGATVNMDYFSVKIDRLPEEMNPEQLLNQIRLNINNFIDTKYSNFSPEDEVDTGFDEVAIWNSNNPVTSILHIEIPGNEGSVICSDKTSYRWRFSTIKAPWDGDHPVSGTREFGFETNADGSYTFYTRGVDRFTDNLAGESLLNALTFGNAFMGADNLWKSFQEGISEYVNQNGGSATKNLPVIGRPDWEKVQSVLLGEVNVESLGCN
jgi:hypothetical protein